MNKFEFNSRYVGPMVFIILAFIGSIVMTTGGIMMLCGSADVGPLLARSGCSVMLFAMGMIGLLAIVFIILDYTGLSEKFFGGEKE